MLLRASGAATGQAFDLHAVTEGAAAARSGEAHEETLLALTESMVGDSEEALATARTHVLAQLGPEALADAAGVASNVELVARSSDATCARLESFLGEMTVDIRPELHLARFASTANPP